MKRASAFLLICALAAPVMAGPVREFEGGILYQADKINILVLSGSYKQIGRQYGGLAGDRIKEFYKVAIEERFIAQEKIPYNLMKEFSSAAFALYPKRLKDITYGMAETSGMELEKLIILESILGLTFLQAEGGEDPGQCSALAAWGDYTGDGPLVIGRNYDSTRFFKDEFAPYLNAVVYRPDDGVPVALLAYAGEITSFTAMNAAGIFFEDNEAVKSGGAESPSDRLVLYPSEVTFLMDYNNFPAFDAAMKTNLSNFAFIANVATKDQAYSYEMTTKATRRRSGPGILAATNDFVDPAWGLALPCDAADKSVQRRENLLKLGEKYKGKITPRKMMEIMDIFFYEGGATWPKRTAYQVVAVPETLTLWLKLRDYQDWVRLELERYFQ
ncbi:MAG: hypothetical protein JW782_03235 [Candidatus Saganbacteria bacterium]|nr:hypothetical protein [Candidatus Saganbacteria bacterium]